MWKARVNAWVNVEEALYTKTNHFQKKVEIPFPLFFFESDSYVLSAGDLHLSVTIDEERDER
jgi:hypothetical protein